ncbi:hypothetical protein DTO166G4_7116 [Paecilomyces variotii]|nr:hypothetical protein DTO166G4_7116 [Paecilomyces variotii]KAJ9241850.1 hypothetical protein DTO166G5_926 [Paecilomyces variotii]KAJ9309685.1 hypothetical protein DTO217A2_975 [Paecilomyces variotii]
MSCMMSCPVRSAALGRLCHLQKRQFTASASRQSKVSILGAAGGIGQSLSLLMKLNPLVSELALYDVKGGLGVAADLSHINTKSKVVGYGSSASGLAHTLDGSDVILIPAGVPRKPGMTRDDLFSSNASIIRDLAKAIADGAPNANILVITNPVNSTVPIVAEVLKSRGVYNSKRLFGVNTLDAIRASRFISQIKGTDPTNENVPIIGGHSGITIIPLVSHSRHPDISGTTLDELVQHIQFAGDEVVQAKNGAGSATLAMALAGARFADSLMRATNGQEGIIETAFVDNPLYKDQGIEFFASMVELGPDGMQRIHKVDNLSPYEENMLKKALPDLAKNIKRGVDFVKETA